MPATCLGRGGRLRGAAEWARDYGGAGGGLPDRDEYSLVTDRIKTIRRQRAQALAQAPKPSDQGLETPSPSSPSSSRHITSHRIRRHPHSYYHTAHLAHTHPHTRHAFPSYRPLFLPSARHARGLKARRGRLVLCCVSLLVLVCVSCCVLLPCPSHRAPS
ncbi:hypothetical protein DFH27DRAFT_47189 [Peziza echinospora]|nr:hypothetical protein DFH27DRAFT_47189 [Peziza echinospora]